MKHQTLYWYSLARMYKQTHLVNYKISFCLLHLTRSMVKVGKKTRLCQGIHNICSSYDGCCLCCL